MACLPFVKANQKLNARLNKFSIWRRIVDFGQTVILSHAIWPGFKLYPGNLRTLNKDLTFWRAFLLAELRKAQVTGISSVLKEKKTDIQTTTRIL